MKHQLIFEVILPDLLIVELSASMIDVLHITLLRADRNHFLTKQVEHMRGDVSSQLHVNVAQARFISDAFNQHQKSAIAYLQSITHLMNDKKAKAIKKL